MAHWARLQDSHKTHTTRVHQLGLILQAQGAGQEDRKTSPEHNKKPPCGHCGVAAEEESAQLRGLPLAAPWGLQGNMPMTTTLRHQVSCPSDFMRGSTVIPMEVSTSECSVFSTCSADAFVKSSCSSTHHTCKASANVSSLHFSSTLKSQACMLRFTQNPIQKSRPHLSARPGCRSY